MSETVYVFIYSESTSESDDMEVIGVYRDYDKACVEMHTYMAEVRSHTTEWAPCFDADFEENNPDFVSFGFYGRGWSRDHVWIGKICAMEVE